jgi:O-antigen ligase
MPMKEIWLAFSAYIAIFSMVIAYNDELKTGANIFCRYINGLVGFYFLQAFFRQGDRLKWFLWALILGGLFPMSLGLYQALTGVQWRPEQAEGIARNIGIWHDGVNMRTYAIQTILGLLLYSALYIKAWNIPLKVMTLSYLAISTVVMVKVYSKAAFLTFGLWILCWTILRRQFALLGLIGIVGLLVTTYFASDLADKIATLFHKEAGFFSGEVEGKMTFHGRWFGWVEMMEKWERLPAMSQMFGSGEMATGAHNDFLQMLFHGGIVGLAIYLSLLIVVGIRIGRNLLAKADELAVAALMVYLMWLIDAVGLVPSAYPAEQWLVWGIVGLCFRIRTDEVFAQPARQPIHALPLQIDVTGGPASAAIAVQRRFPLLSDRGGS